MSKASDVTLFEALMWAKVNSKNEQKWGMILP